MKKKFTSIIFGAFFYGFVFCVSQFSFGQTSNILRGKIVEEKTQKPIEDVSIKLTGTDLLVYSDEKGFFQLEYIPLGEYELIIYVLNFRMKTIPVVISVGNQIDLGVIFLEKEGEQINFSNVISLDENEFLDDDDGGSNYITGFLQSSKSVFLRTAAFSFGQARFKIRGYDSNERLVSINGIPMNKFYDGRPQWSNWGGLNDVLRNQTTSHGIGFTKFSGSQIGGSINMNTRAAAYRKGTSFSTAGTNGNYRGRLMFSHFSGIQSNKWSYAISLSTRFANSGFVEGTPYKSWSGFFAFGKEIGKNHSLNFTALFTPNERGKSSPVTKEIYDIKGNKYNSYWGLQNGKLRNSRIKKVVEPIFMVSHDWKINEKLKVTSSMSYQFGFTSNSRLGYRNAENPDPTYYKKLPSYYLRFEADPDYTTAYLSLKEFQNNGQVNWNDLYLANATTGKANYYLFEDKNENKRFSFNSSFEYTINENYSWSVGMMHIASSSENFAKLIDGLGMNEILDIDPYLEGSAAQNNLQELNRIVSVGDDFSYKYELNSNKTSFFSQLNTSSYKWEGSVAAGLEFVNYQRKGLYQNGAFPENSFGKGKKKYFTGFHLKTEFNYKFSGRKLLKVNVGYFVQPPYNKNVFSNIRYNHNFTPNINSVRKFSSEVSYEFRTPTIKLQATSYYSRFYDDTEINFIYADGLKRDEADFVSQIVSGVEKLHLGAELGAEWKATETIKIYGVAALGSFKYSNNPKLYIESDLYQDKESFFGSTFIKNYKISGTPQNAYSLGFEYRDPKYWWYQINGNYLTDNYLQIAPLIRTKNFFTDSDGVPVINEETGKQISKDEIHDLWKQEKFPALFLLNIVGGKSWKIKESYLGFFISVNNVLNTVYRTGGFEQSRNAKYQNYVEGNRLEQPVFSSKYWYSQGTSYYWILSYRF